MAEDLLAMEVGYRRSLVDNDSAGVNCSDEILRTAQKLRAGSGILPPAADIRDNLERHRRLPDSYQRCGVGAAEAQPGRRPAIILVMRRLFWKGRRHAGTGLWFTGEWDPNVISRQAQAQIQGYTVVSASTAAATAQPDPQLGYRRVTLSGRQEAQMLYDPSEKEMPKLADDLIPQTLSRDIFHRVLQNLLTEKVTIRDMRTIIETLAEQVGENGEQKGYGGLLTSQQCG
ncbi:FHIPEP family type III secretion protein [Shigella flexneri]